MIKLIYVLGLLVLIAAGVVFMHCVTLLLEDSPGNEMKSDMPIVERFEKIEGGRGINRQTTVSPLVKQATAYALYLTPPVPKAPKATAKPRNSMRSVHRAANVRPKFRLLSTTYYRSDPERSLALVSEPGKGDHWVKKDERLGHFTVESVKAGSIVYRDGGKLHEIKVPVKQTAQLARIRTTASAASPGGESDLRRRGATQQTKVE